MNEIKEELVKTGSIQRLTGLPEDLRKTFVVSMDISAEDHMQMQAAFQRYVDNSISKTINFPNSASKEDVANGFILAWQLKCKACTVYRDGSREVQILNIGTGEGLRAPSDIGKRDAAPRQATQVDSLPMDAGRIPARERPEVMSGKTYKVTTGYGRLYVTVNNDDQGVPFEVFATIGKSGGFFQEQSEGICRMISLALRSGIKIEEIVRNLKGIRGPMPTLTNNGTVLSLPDAIGQILERHVQESVAEQSLLDGTPKEGAFILDAIKQPARVAPKKTIAEFGMMPGCPDCGAPLVLAEGCMSCKSCGYSRCM